MNAISLTGVFRAYGSIKAVAGVSLDVAENCLFGLIGPDGAGKTTLFRMITSLLTPDAGSIRVFGHDAVRDFRIIRQFTGYMPGRFSLYPDLTVAENMNFYATIFKADRKENYHLVKSIYSHLEPFENRLARDLSGGMKQKLALSCALIHNPRLLVLDEPTTGVDAVSRKEFWESLIKLKETGMTILVSTPYMDEAAKCDRIALMQTGVIMEQGTPDEIPGKFSGKLFEVKSATGFNILGDIRSLPVVQSAYLFGESIHVNINVPVMDAPAFAEIMLSKGHRDLQVREISPGIEDCFIEAVEELKLKTDK